MKLTLLVASHTATLFNVKEYNVILCCTGSVASVKVPDIISQLQSSALKITLFGIMAAGIVAVGILLWTQFPYFCHVVCDLNTQINLKVIATANAAHFFNLSTLSVPCFGDSELEKFENNDDCDLVYELSDWADLLIIAPLDANSLGKIAAGVADNLLTMVVRSWDTKRPLLFAPAMNTFMWNHPVTERNIGVLCAFGFQEIKCIEKTLVCGDKGMGAMATVETIVSKIEEHLEKLRCDVTVDDLPVLSELQSEFG